MSNLLKAAVVVVMIASGLSAPRPAAAYSVLAHEANLDPLWDSTIAPMPRARFPGASPEQIQEARGYAYGGCVVIEMKDVFFNEDLAIGTYRHAVATTIPEMTKVAWSKKPDEIRNVIPGAQKKTVVFNLRRPQYEKEFGSDYEKPGFTRFLGFMDRLIPKIGPFRALSFSVIKLS
jgi:hypothetical protein